MINPQGHSSLITDIDVLVHDRQHELLKAAQQVRLARQARAARPRRIRSRAGWWLVQTGIRLVLSANPPAARSRHKLVSPT